VPFFFATCAIFHPECTIGGQGAIMDGREQTGFLGQPRGIGSLILVLPQTVPGDGIGSLLSWFNQRVC
jgi:hypothetical protein